MPYATEARRFGEQVAEELQLTFARVRLRPKAMGTAPTRRRACVNTVPIPADLVARPSGSVGERVAR